VSSVPEAGHDANKLTWKLGNMARGETKAIKVTVKADKEGESASCATVSAVPRVCSSTMVGKAQLAIQKTGPAMAQLGANVTYNVTVQNTGNTTARNVVVTDPLAEGFSSPTGQKELSFNVGDLAAGASKTMQVVLKADKRGRLCNKALVASSNAVRLWRVSDGMLFNVLDTGPDTGGLSPEFSPDGKTLASASGDGTIKLWNPTTGNDRLTMEGKKCVFSIAYSPDGKWLATGGARRSAESVFRGRDVAGHTAGWRRRRKLARALQS
jgi:uncharacterized repeat protein (TIGR01451 family)